MADELSLLMAALNDGDASRRAIAAERLARLGEAAQPAAVPLTRLCGDKEEMVQQWAVAALEELGPPSPADAEALAELLDGAAADVGYWAATLLGRLGEDGAVVAGPLGNALMKSPHVAVRERAAWALGQIGPAAREMLPRLREAAASKDARLARLAQQAISRVE